MKKAHRSLILVAVLLASAAILTAGLADAQIANASYGAAAVTFTPTIDAEGMVLTVAGGGKWYRLEFAAGQTPSFSIYGQKEALADGLYKWELSPIMTRAQVERGDYSDRGVRDGGNLELEAAAPSLGRQMGWFTILNGSIVDPTLSEASAPAGEAGEGSFSGGDGSGPRARGSALGPVANTVLTNANGVIRNSLCVGFDCPNSPVFSDSTILLMENNTRIKFGDTSNSPFPNRDWEIEANSNLSGGASYLGFNDCGTSDNDGGCTTDLVFAVEAGARQSALYVESDGDVGLGTSNPVLDLHIVSGNTPSLRLEQDGSSGFAPQVWDVAGNETNFFIRDVTSGSALPFRIQPGAPSNSIFIDDSGDVAIGHTSPTADLDITDSGTANIKFASTGGNGQIWNLQTDAGSNNFAIRDASGTAANVFIIEEGFDAEIMRLNAAGQVLVQGAPVHPDYVFEPDYALESIEEHAEYMFTNKHLPAVGAGTYTEDGKPFISLGDRSQGMLEELEKAHVFIALLNERLREREAAMLRLEESQDQLTAEVAELRRSLADGAE